jgi:hypothetical protein
LSPSLAGRARKNSGSCRCSGVLPFAPAGGDTFPWPQAPTRGQTQAVAAAALDLRTLETPGKNPLRDAHQQLDAAVRAAYGMKPKQDSLAFLLALNRSVAAREAQGQPVTAPGLPPA